MDIVDLRSLSREPSNAVMMPQVGFGLLRQGLCRAHQQLDAGHCATEEQRQFAVGFPTTLGDDFRLGTIAGAFNVTETKHFSKDNATDLVCGHGVQQQHNGIAVGPEAWAVKKDCTLGSGPNTEWYLRSTKFLGNFMTFSCWEIYLTKFMPKYNVPRLDIYSTSHSGGNAALYETILIENPYDNFTYTVVGDLDSCEQSDLDL
uniref:Uncharacterized protein n=1 Tax=Romanomermis culicivorax TaxID=13658 RepID=A0A915JFT5_ROMCU